MTKRPQKIDVPAQEWNPIDVFGRSPSSRRPSNTSSMGHAYKYASSPAQPSSSVASSSSYSAVSGMSFGASGASTSPTSVGMARQDSLGSSSFCKGVEMLRVDSRISNNIPNYNGIMEESPIDIERVPSFHDAYPVPTRPVDTVHDISLAGAQFSTSIPNAAGQPMQRQVSSNSRRLEPKSTAALAMSRTPSSAEGHEMIRVSSSDGSYKDAVKIPKVLSYVRPTHDKVMCPHPGCTAQPKGYKGEHEMQRHFDRAHEDVRRVFVCAPCANDPDFLSTCKSCQSYKIYNADYNAGEHLRRMHFNPKQPKIRRGTLKPEERRGGKGGGDWPPMERLRDFMITYEVNADGAQVSDAKKVNDHSTVIMPDLADGTKQDEVALAAASIGSPIPQIMLFGNPDSAYDYASVSISTTQPLTRPRFIAGSMPTFGLGQRAQASNTSPLSDGSPIEAVSTAVEDHFNLDLGNPSPDFLNDPLLYDNSHTGNPVLPNGLDDFFPSLR